MGMPRGAQGGRDKGGPNNYGPSGPYGPGGGGLGISGGHGGAGWQAAGPAGPAGGGRGSIEMPNIQALGLSSGAAGGQSGSNPMAGLNIGALPMNPALVAAALNQAGWSLMGNLQSAAAGNPPTPATPAAAGPAEHAFPTPTSFSAPVNVTSSTMTSAAQQAAQVNSSAAGILTGWGPSAAGPGAPGAPATGAPGGEAIPPQTPPTVTPQHHPGGSWPTQSREKQQQQQQHGWKTYSSDM